MLIPQEITIKKYQILESTNKTAWNLISEDPHIQNHLIIAEQQTGGRGRYDRKWESPVGNLYFSLILREENLQMIEKFPFIVAVSLVRAVDHFASKKFLDIQIQNKWPNDLLLNEHKAAGILIESSKNQNGAYHAVIGVGLNLISNPMQTSYPAINLREVGLNVNKDDFLVIFLEKFCALCMKFKNFGFAPIRNLWLKNVYKLKEEIVVSLENKKVVGLFEEIDEDGNLVLLVDKSQQRMRISAADIIPIPIFNK